MRLLPLDKVGAFSVGTCLAAVLVGALWWWHPAPVQRAEDNARYLAARFSAPAADDDAILALPKSAANRELALQHADLMEAVFRYQFEHNTSGRTPPASTDSVYISLDKDEDPPPELLERFENHSPPIEPVSAAGMERVDGVRSRYGGYGIIFRIESVQWIDAETANVEGGYYCGGTCASGNTYRAERKKGKWVVVKDSMHWIS